MKPEFAIPAAFVLALLGWLVWVSAAHPPVDALMLHFLTHQPEPSP